MFLLDCLCRRSVSTLVAAAESAIPPVKIEHFNSRHVGVDAEQERIMLSALGCMKRDDFIGSLYPRQSKIHLADGISEPQMKADFGKISSMNKAFRSYIGMGYFGTYTPQVIQRGILENPMWYTPYTPYQAEISQGRLEVLFNFQTMVCELTGFPIANASLLDEGHAACEAMTMLFNTGHKESRTFLVDESLYLSTAECLKLRALGLGVRIRQVNMREKVDCVGAFGGIFQYPDRYGSIDMMAPLGIPMVACTDLLACTMIKPPGELGFDVAIGSAQRLGIPLGCGGPHAAFFACKEKYKRALPGRIVGLTRDVVRGNPGYRLALQTREQHIRREKATSNICTSQALLANMAAMYAVYHGPEGLRRIANRIHGFAVELADIAERFGHSVTAEHFFDTILIEPQNGYAEDIHAVARQYKVNLGRIDNSQLSISLDETTDRQDLEQLVRILAMEPPSQDPTTEDLLGSVTEMEPSRRSFGIPDALVRTSQYLRQMVFNSYHSETALMRYVHSLGSKDITLVNSMMPLGSCTMKLNGATELLGLSMTKLMDVHPLAPVDQLAGYMKVFEELRYSIARLTGLPKVCLQPNSGAQGELLGLMLIRRAQPAERDVCLIPTSAHGTNPASARLAGLDVVSVDCSKDGSLNLSELERAVSKYAARIGAFMVTYPSTFGTFDENLLKAIEIVHEAGGLVYLDGANMNALAGYVTPADLGADVCHLNLHKTFCIPHGGGGPGVGPIALYSEILPAYWIFNRTERLFKYLPAVGSIASAPFGSASILPISWAYMKMMGIDGIREATYKAVLSANYLKAQLSEHYPVLFDQCAHEFIVDIRPIEETCGVSATDIAKRLQDYGFHAPTLSWPIRNTLMIEPTECENVQEIHRFLEAMIGIRDEIRQIEEGKADRNVNLLKCAPHTSYDLIDWKRPYSIRRAFFPLPVLLGQKQWPAVNRLDEVYGDQNLVCSRLY